MKNMIPSIVVLMELASYERVWVPKTTSSTETFEVPDATSEIKARGFWKAGLEGFPSWEHHCISSFSDADSIRYFSRASSNVYKKGKYTIYIKVRERPPVQPIQNPA